MLRIFRSTAFIFTLLYMALFSASTAVLMVFIYQATIREMEGQIKQSINIQLADLGRKFILDGPKDTVATINHLVDLDPYQRNLFMLIDPRWRVIAGNLKRWPGGTTQQKDWVRFSIEPHIRDPQGITEALAINTTLPGGYILLVGYRLHNVEKVRQVIFRTMLISFAIAILLGAVGGALLYRNIYKRIETINHTCRKVIEGDFGERVKEDGSGDEFDYLGQNINAMLARIDELVDGIRNISVSIAHDLRTPLTRVRNRLEALSKQADKNPEVAQQVRECMHDIDELAATFRALLRISEAERGVGSEHFDRFNLSAVVNDLVELYGALGEAKQVRIDSRIEPQQDFIGERHLLSQAIANLLDNAVKYSPEGKDVQVTLIRTHKGPELVVADHGPGIPESYYSKVTEKFFRMESSRHSPGNGLGLSLVQAVVKLHGGELLFADNRPGLRVTLRLYA